ncbi:SDR family oxidoreductase [Streptomyces goshikiensis]|uniref:SDR family oxidoreductase n=1 Tax=Streptomyces goshikiensis TaxID=1942 RepID=UPI0037FB07A0
MSNEAIAVIGLSARVPDAADAEAFWGNLLAGRDSIHQLSESQLLAAGEDPELLKDPHYVRARPLLDDVGGFDNRYFGISPRESELRNPQHRLFLELCSTALQHAGLEPSQYEGEIGVYGGCASDRYVDDHVKADPELLAQVGEMVALVSNNIDYLTTYTSYRLGLTGPSLNVRTACSTSLVATHLACQALRLGDCDIALAGGVEIETPYGHGYRHVDGGIDSADGHCRPLDSEASGTVFGSGGGVVVLKRLADALEDGDPVYAVLKGSAINNDGSERPGFTAPSSKGQSRAIAEALAVADVDPATVSYVELHGTGTKVGDPIEIQGLHEAMRVMAEGQLQPASCAIGSVKSNLGHLGPASGIVGLIKTVLALHHEKIPPTINVRTPNPQLKLEQTPFRIADRALPWPRVAGAPRRAGVSSFGFGGTNAHVVLEEGPLPTDTVGRPERPELLVWSSVDEASGTLVRAGLAAALDGLPDGSAADVAFTSQVGRRALPVRAALRFSRPSEAAKVLANPAATPTAQSDGVRRLPAFALPGQGSQHPYAAVGLAASVPDFDRRIRECLSMFSDALGIDLVKMWQNESEPDAVARTVHAQPLLFSIEYALAGTLGTLGIEPSVLLGHSVGEVVAGTLAGVFSLPDAVRFIARRAELMQSMPPGRMLALAASEDTVRALLAPNVAVSAVNGDQQVVVGGKADAVEGFQALMAARGVEARLLPTSHAFHTPMMAPAVDELTALLGQAQLRAPLVPVISAASGRLLTVADATSPRFWAEQLVEPVLFRGALDTLAGHDPVRVLEVGPGQALTSLARRHEGMREGRHRVVACQPRYAGRADQDADWGTLLTALAETWCDGTDVAWDAVPRPEGTHRVALPAYPYQRKEFWLPFIGEGKRFAAAQDAHPAAAPEAEAGAEAATVAVEPTAKPSGSGRSGEPVIALAGWSPSGVTTAITRTTPGSRGHAVVLTPADRTAARELLTAMQLAGYRAIPMSVGEEYAATDYQGTVRPGHPEDVSGYLDHLAERSVDVRAIVHGRAYAPADLEQPSDSGEAFEDAVWSFVELFQTVADRRGRDSRPLPITVVTRSAVGVTTAETLAPARAATCALVRSAALESAAGQVRLIDVGGVQAAVLATELAAPPHADAVVALRGNRRWLADRSEIELGGAVGTLLEERGVYVITGGFGAIGLAVAEALAHSGLRPRLALLGRKAADPEEVERVAPRLAAMESAGAEVTLHAVDVSDAGAVKDVFHDLQGRYGSIHGVIHTAGIAGGGLLRSRARGDMEAVLAAKVAGTRNLQEITARTPGMRFLMLFSSRAALNGLLGSADYAAANAFMDAAALLPPPGAPVTVSVNWPAWHEVGMAATAPVRAAERTGSAGASTLWQTVVEPGDWVVDEHRLEGRALLPGAAYFDLLVRAAREVGGADDLDPLVIEDLMLNEPLFVADPARVTVELARTSDGGWDATVRSEPVGEGDPLEAATVHARAHLRADASLAAERPSTEPAALGAGWPSTTPGAPTGSATEFTFGERFSCVRAAFRDEDVTVGRLGLADEHLTDLDTHAVHPALLDRSLALNLPAGDFVPFTCRRAVVYGELPGHLVARMVRRPEQPGRSTVDAELYDMLGRAVVTVTGYTKIARGTDRQSADNAIAPTPAADAQPAGKAAAVGITTGISLAEGIATLMRLLTDSVPPQVAVVPAGQWTATPVPADIRPPAALPVVSEQSAPVTPPVPAGQVSTGARAPEGPEVRLAEVLRLLAETLGLPGVGPDDDFFSIGGDSLTAVQLVSRLQDRFGVRMSVADLFDAPTPAAVASVIGAKKEQRSDTA